MSDTMSGHLASLEREASERHDVQALGQSREGG